MMRAMSPAAPSAPGLRRGVACALLAAVAVATPGGAWHTSGHATVARAAAAALPADVPAFFRSGADAIGEASVDPDVMKDRATPRLRAFESPEHYLDWEVIDRGALPEDRYAMVALLGERKLTPQLVGFLPYATAEAVERLTLAFAEHRRWPEDPRIQQKALVYAGLLAHYAGDLEQPLHTSIHHDGRALPDHSSPHTGIHTLTDALFDTVPLDVAALTRELPVRDLGDHWAAIATELAASHALVDEVYRLEPLMRLDVDRGDAPPPPELAAFAGERFRTTASFLASLFYTAWQRSAAIQLPPWLHREPPPAPVPKERAEVILRPRN